MSHDAPRSKTKREILQGIVAVFKAAYPEWPLDTESELIAVGEHKVALEILLDNLVELHGWGCPAAAYGDVVSLAKELALDPRYWDRLHPV
jgi:hypothetical protein